MTVTKTLLATALLAAAGVAQAELSANLGVQSNYYFRGITQTDDKAAISGGIDYAHDSGLYVGTWMSNVDFGGKEDVEIDGYAGFANDIGDTGLSYDVSAWYYWYPGSGGDAQGGELDYAEVIGSLSYWWLTGTIAYNVWAEADGPGAFQDGDLWYELAVDPGWSYEGFAPTASIGYFSFDDDGEDDGAGNDLDLDYMTWSIGISKDVGDFGSLSVNYVQIDDANDVNPDDNPNFWIGWAKDF
ncbi:MAG: TorF family putative porin [Thiogranum sp.]